MAIVLCMCLMKKKIPIPSCIPYMFLPIQAGKSLALVYLYLQHCSGIYLSSRSPLIPCLGRIAYRILALELDKMGMGRMEGRALAVGMRAFAHARCRAPLPRRAGMRCMRAYALPHLPRARARAHGALPLAALA